MLHGPQGGHFVREAVANPAFLTGAPVEPLHGQPGATVPEAGGFVNHRESASGHNPAQTIASRESLSGIVIGEWIPTRWAGKFPMTISPPQQEHSLFHPELGSF